MGLHKAEAASAAAEQAQAQPCEFLPSPATRTLAVLLFILGLKKRRDKRNEKEKECLIGELCDDLEAFMKHLAGEEVETIDWVKLSWWLQARS